MKAATTEVISLKAFALLISICFPVQAKGLPQILVFAVVVAKWSDGTAPPMHQEKIDHYAIATSHDDK